MNMADNFEEKFIKPIINASYPGTLAGLALAVLQITTNIPWYTRDVLLTGALTFLLSAFFLFFYTIYPARKRFWTIAATAFLIGLFCAILATLLFFAVS
jgi:hydrogenase-4 membrane subunit HyfE